MKDALRTELMYKCKNNIRFKGVIGLQEISNAYAVSHILKSICNSIEEFYLKNE